jgi:RNA polymerase sigma factor (sigma-70 family)
METEVVLLRRFARTGDAEAFGEIIRRHAGLVYGAAWRILADMDRAGDVAQETFLQLTKDAAKVTGSLPGWLHRVATHKAIDLVRRDSSRKQRETRYAAVQPRETTSWREISVHVDEGLNALDAEMREILVAHFLEGQSTRQIAGVRGVSQATVSRRLEAGVVTLRGRLRKRGLLVAAGTLSLLLGERAVSAAPAALKAELGKMALVGGQAAVVSVSGAAVAAGTWSGVQTVIEGALAGGQAKAVAAAVVAAISVGSIVTYCQVTKPSAVEPISTYGTARSATVARAGVPMATGKSSGRDRVMTVAFGPTAVRGAAANGKLDSDRARNLVSSEREADSSAEGALGGLPTAVYSVVSPGGEAMDQDAERALADTANGPYASRVALAVPGPNDANDPNDESSLNLDRK